MAQAAEILGIAKQTLYISYIKLGVPHYRIGGKIVFRESELEKWFQEQRVSA